MASVGEVTDEGVKLGANPSLEFEPTAVESLCVVACKPVLVAQQLLQEQHNQDLQTENKACLNSFALLNMKTTKTWDIALYHKN